MEEEDLINAADRLDFDAYVRARGHDWARLGALLLGDWHLGEDLAQDVLARLSFRWSKVTEARNVDAYVYRALTNTAVSWRRRRSWRERPTGELPEQASEDVLFDDVVLRALKELTPQQRAVVVLRHYSDQSERETATLLGCSVGTVKSQNFRALARLRELLALDRETT